MAGPQSPIGSRRRLGAELRALRRQAGMTLDEVAERMTCSTSKISRLETGKGIPKVPDVSELIRIYGVTDEKTRERLIRLVHDGREHGWWEPLTDGVAHERFVLDAPGRYAALETAAVAVRAFELTVVHGLLQTPAYSRAVIEAILPHHSAAQIERLVELRQRRQRALVERDRPLELHVVLDEAVLRRVVGTPALMAEQLRAVLDRSELPNVTVRVLPFDEGYLRSHVGPFVVLEFPSDDPGSDVVFIEGHAGHTYLETPSDVALYKDVLSDAAARALDPRASRAAVRRYLDVYDS